MSIDLARFPLLASLDTPSQLRQLSEHQLVQVAQELREFILAALNICGGHFAANLGTVELAIALHYVFNTPQDHLIWDVGHQAYPHKILTGRRDCITTIRQLHGLGPFPSRTESIYDAFGVGHSSTSISAALGMAVADHRQQQPHKTVAIIGDGAMTAGMAFEALNHGGDLKEDLLVILNDNEMSISENVGALANYLGRVLSSKLYLQLREGSKKVLDHLPAMRELARRTEEQMKGFVIPGALFESLGFNYIGPIDGHDLKGLVNTLRNLHDLQGPQLLHVITRKGKGYPPAEADPIGYHAVKPGFLDEKVSTTSSKLTYSKVFGQWICDRAERDPKLVAITPAMREGSDLVQFSKQFPDRYFDVGIAEQHSVTFAAGVACQGMKPVVAIYSTFLQRAYDQLIHDVALQNLPVLFAIDRGGLVGGDGITHNGSFDLSFLRCIPNLTIMAPSDENECYRMLSTGFAETGPCAVRYPRGTGPGVPIDPESEILPIGKAEVHRRGQDIALLAFGSMVTPALEAGEQLNATVVNMRFVKPLDETLICELAKTHKLLVTIEENVIKGGAGSGVHECLAAHHLLCHILHLGLPDQFVDHGNPQALLAELGLDAKGIIAAVEKIKSQLITFSPLPQ